MSFAEDHLRAYRVKFVDIRANPPGGRRGRAREDVRRCEAKGCDDPGVCKAPKPFAARVVPIPGQKEPPENNHWFCQRHAAEYNRTYDFFDGMTEAEITAFHASANYGHKRTWKFGGGPVGAAGRAQAFHSTRRWRGRSWLDPNEGGGEARPARGRTRLQVRALEELELPADASVEAIKLRYAELVKRFHPDSNGGDRSTEHRLTVVIRAFKALKASGLG